MPDFEIYKEWKEGWEVNHFDETSYTHLYIDNEYKGNPKMNSAIVGQILDSCKIVKIIRQPYPDEKWLGEQPLHRIYAERI